MNIFYFNHGTLNRELDRAAEKARIHRIRIHDLRHSHAAMLVEPGYSIMAVAERLGDTVEVAMATYSHLYPDKKQGMADDLDRRAKGEPPAMPDGTASLDDVSEQLERVLSRIMRKRFAGSGQNVISRQWRCRQR